MNQQPKKKSNATKAVIAVIAMLAILIGGVSYWMITYNPAGQTQEEAEKQLYKIIISEASDIEATMHDINEIETLKKTIDDTKVGLNPGVVTSDTTIYWEAAAQTRSEQGGGLFYTSSQVYACYQLRADVQKKEVTVQPQPCSTFENLPLNDLSGKEISLDEQRVNIK